MATIHVMFKIGLHANPWEILISFNLLIRVYVVASENLIYVNTATLNTRELSHTLTNKLQVTIVKAIFTQLRPADH